MLKQLAAEYHFRRGRRSQDIAHLQRAARLNVHNSRAAIELGRLGVADPICGSLFMALSGLRDYAVRDGLSPDVSELLRLIVENLADTRGQIFQDVVALWASGEKPNGFFVEVGTGNGELLSNTYMLEKQFGWHGILFEPDRRFHASIRDKRSAILDTRAAYSEDSEARQFMEVKRAGELSTLTSHASDDGRNRSGSLSTVATTTLTHALSQHNAPSSIDFMSIDTEGSEMEVLKGVDFDQFDVHLLAVEHNFADGRKNEIASFLRPFGYRELFPEFSHHDIWLIKER